MYELSGSDQSKMETYLNQNLFATLAGTALASANYYILKGAHTVSDCPANLSRRLSKIIIKE
jgi:hypothetical protein